MYTTWRNKYTVENTSRIITQSYVRIHCTNMLYAIYKDSAARY